MAPRRVWGQHPPRGAKADLAEEVLAARSARAHGAAEKAFTDAKQYPDARALFQAASRLLPRKATNPHDIKFPVAMFENYRLVNDQWRPHMLAATVFSFLGNDKPDTPVIRQVGEALRKL